LVILPVFNCAIILSSTHYLLYVAEKSRGETIYNRAYRLIFPVVRKLQIRPILDAVSHEPPDDIPQDICVRKHTIFRLIRLVVPERAACLLLPKVIYREPCIPK